MDCPKCGAPLDVGAYTIHEDEAPWNLDAQPVTLWFRPRAAGEHAAAVHILDDVSRKSPGWRCGECGLIVVLGQTLLPRGGTAI